MRGSVSKTLTEMPLVVNALGLMLKQESVYFSLVDVMTATMLAEVSYVLQVCSLYIMPDYSLEDTGSRQ